MIPDWAIPPKFRESQNAKAEILPSSRKKTSADRRRDQEALRSRERFSGLAEIGPIPRVADPARRESCQWDLRKYLTTYFPYSTGLKPFSPDHDRIIARIQEAVLHGDRQVNAMYRGFAKTTISENTALWAVTYGHRRFVPVFSATKAAADDVIDSLRLELETNDLLAEDFPEVCLPIRALEGKPQRCPAQTCDGERTRIEWTADTIVLPTIRVPAGWMPDAEGGTFSPASGAILKSKGLLGAARGMKHKRPDGVQQRPDFVILDDPQTDLSAASPFQTDKRLGIIRRAILKLAGHSGGLAVVVNGNIIVPDDLIDQLLRREENAAWNGARVPMVRRWSDAHETLWQRYAEIRRNYAKDELGDQQRAHREATEFYRANRESMDAGCEVSWEHCFDESSEVSAVQHAYNQFIDDGPDVFAAECQNDPAAIRYGDETLTAAQIVAKVNGRKSGTCPASVQKVTAFVDVHDKLLYWVAVGWGDDFSGWVLGYGAWPSQKAAYFTLRDTKQTLGRKYPGTGKEGAIVAGLAELIDTIGGKVWPRDDGVQLTVGRVLVDAGYQPDLVAQAVRKATRGPLIFPSMGMPVGAKQSDMTQWQRRPGEKMGHHWILGKAPSLPGFLCVKFDSNFWKTAIMARLAVPLGDRGCLSLPGSDPAGHRLLADHLVAEYPTWTEGRGRRLQEWSLKPGGVDNHLLDCCVGCMVGASTLGLAVEGPGRAVGQPTRLRRRRISYLGEEDVPVGTYMGPAGF